MTARPYDMADDDLSRQRRKRDERLLAQAVPEAPDLTVGDLVADVLAATATGREVDPGGELDIRDYLAERGHDWPTIKTVVDYLDRQVPPAPEPPARRRRPLP